MELPIELWKEVKSYLFPTRCSKCDTETKTLHYTKDFFGVCKIEFNNHHFRNQKHIPLMEDYEIAKHKDDKQMYLCNQCYLNKYKIIKQYVKYTENNDKKLLKHLEKYDIFENHTHRSVREKNGLLKKLILSTFKEDYKTKKNRYLSEEENIKDSVLKRINNTKEILFQDLFTPIQRDIIIKNLIKMYNQKKINLTDFTDLMYDIKYYNFSIFKNKYQRILNKTELF